MLRLFLSSLPRPSLPGTLSELVRKSWLRGEDADTQVTEGQDHGVWRTCK